MVFGNIKRGILTAFLCTIFICLFSQEKWSGKHETFSEGLAVFYQDEKGGYINEKREIIIPAQYDAAIGFSEGLAAVMIDNKVGYINPKGEMVLEPKDYYCLGVFNGGYARLCVDDKIGLMDMEGKQIIPPKYDYIEPVLGNLVKVTNYNKKYESRRGVLNLNNEVVFPLTYKAQIQLLDTGGFILQKEDLDCKCKYCNKKKYYLYYETGGEYQNVELDFPYTEIKKINDNFSLVVVDEIFGMPHLSEVRYFGLIDQDYKVVLPPVYKSIEVTADSIKVELEGKKVEYYRIDKIKGDIYSYEEVRIKKTNDRTFSYSYDDQGIIGLEADSIVPAYIVLDRGPTSIRGSFYGYVSMPDHSLVIPFQFDKADHFSADLAIVERHDQDCDTEVRKILNISRDGHNTEGPVFDNIEIVSPLSSIGTIGFLKGFAESRFGIHSIDGNSQETEVIYNDIIYLGDGFFKLMKGQEFWLFHEKRGFVFTDGIPEISKRSYTSFGLMVYQQPDESYRYIDTSGYILPGVYEYGSAFFESGKASVVQNGRRFEIDSRGKEVLPLTTLTEKAVDGDYKLLVASSLYHDERVQVIDVSTDGKYFLSYVEDEARLNIWNTYSGELINSYQKEIDLISQPIVKFLEGNLFLIATEEKVEVYDLLTGQIKTLDLSDNDFFSTRFDGTSSGGIVINGLFISGDRSHLGISIIRPNRNVILINLDDFSQSILPNTGKEIESVLSLRDGKIVFTERNQEDKNIIHVYDWEKEKMIGSIDTDFYPQDAEYTSGYLFCKYNDDDSYKRKLTAFKLKKKKKVINGEYLSIQGVYPQKEKVYLSSESGISYFDLSSGTLFKTVWESREMRAEKIVSDGTRLIDGDGRVFSVEGRGGIAIGSLKYKRLIKNIKKQQELIYADNGPDGKLVFHDVNSNVFGFDLAKLEGDFFPIEGNGNTIFEISPEKRYAYGLTPSAFYSQLKLFALNNPQKQFSSISNGLKGFFSQDESSFWFFDEKDQLKRVDLQTFQVISEFNLKGEIDKYEPKFSTNSSLTHGFYINPEKNKIIKIDLQSGKSKTILTQEKKKYNWLNESYANLLCWGEEHLAYVNQELDETIVIYNWERKEVVTKFKIPFFWVDYLHYNDSLNLLVLTSRNGLVRFFDTEANELLSLTLLIKNNNYLVFDEEEKFYFGDKKLFRELRFARAGQVEGAAAFELTYNRPDSLLSLYSFTDKQYAKQLSRLIQLRKANQGVGVASNQLICNIKPNNSSYFQESADYELSYEVLGTEKPQFANLIIRVNGVVVNAQNETINSVFEETEKITLQQGINRIEVFAKSGVDSISNVDVLELYSLASPVTRKMYFIGMGIKEYKTWGNLDYSVEDVRKAAITFSQSPLFDTVLIDTFFNGEVHADVFDKLEKKLSQLSPDDYVVIYLSGHGKTNEEDGEFYFIGQEAATEGYANSSISFQKFEALLNKASSRNRIMFIDACESGNVDQSNLDTTKIEVVIKEDEKGLRPRKKKNQRLQAQFQRMEEMFNNYNNSFGGVTIAASSGYESAKENDDLKNGVFTYFLLKALTDKDADRDKNGEIYLSELVEYLRQSIDASSYSGQTVSTRSWNLEYDYRIW